MPTKEPSIPSNYMFHSMTSLLTVPAARASLCASDLDGVSSLLHMLPPSCLHSLSLSDAAENRWTSCSFFESPLQLCVDDAVLIEQLVRAALASKDTSCLQLLLTVASSSVSINKACAAAWMDGGLFRALVAAFTPEQATATRKVAFDLAFAVVHARLSIETSDRSSSRQNSGDFGLERLVLDAGGAGCAAAAREYQAVSLLVVSALGGCCASRS